MVRGEKRNYVPVKKSSFGFKSALVEIIKGIRVTIERSKVCRFRVSWEHARVWTRPKCLVDLFDR